MGCSCKVDHLHRAGGRGQQLVRQPGQPPEVVAQVGLVDLGVVTVVVAIGERRRQLAGGPPQLDPSRARV